MELNHSSSVNDTEYETLQGNGKNGRVISSFKLSIKILNSYDFEDTEMIRALLINESISSYYVPPQCLKRMPYIKLGCRRVGEYSENHPPLKWPLDLL